MSKQCLKALYCICEMCNVNISLKLIFLCHKQFEFPHLLLNSGDPIPEIVSRLIKIAQLIVRFQTLKLFKNNNNNNKKKYEKFMIVLEGNLFKHDVMGAINILVNV